MNYYEELGLTRAASAEEIRQAYRELARLLHPDQQQDEGLRRAAERQMKRLNQVVAVLSDPAARRRYDLSLAGGPLVRLEAARVLAERAAQAVRQSWVWLMTAGIAAAGLAYYFGTQTPARGGSVQIAVPPAEAVVSQSEPAPPVERVRRRVLAEARKTERDAEAMELPPEVVAAAPSVLAPVLAPPASPTVATPVAQPPVPKATPTPSGLAGTWLYVPPRVPERQELMYPPEYIELRLIEQDGLVYGRYRARYAVTDRTLWPEVNFEFEGKREQESFAWRGTEGACGEVRLKPVGPGRLEVSWWASELGARLSLASGTAVLVRERE
ncbi:MAG: DnaJ domain-containing protein [Bryobacteraceae bacterium]